MPICLHICLRATGKPLGNHKLTPGRSGQPRHDPPPTRGFRKRLGLPPRTRETNRARPDLNGPEPVVRERSESRSLVWDLWPFTGTPCHSLRDRTPDDRPCSICVGCDCVTLRGPSNARPRSARTLPRFAVTPSHDALCYLPAQCRIINSEYARNIGPRLCRQP
jgi:hypothetical protein